MTELLDTAFYYPGVIWHDVGWVKSLALFFDQIALLVPDYMRDRPRGLDPAIAGPLEDAGLLRMLSPETLIGPDASQRLATAMTDIIASGALDSLPSGGAFQELSWSRMGGIADPGLAQMILEELQVRGLASPSEDGLSIPMHGTVRSLYLVLLAQILREAGRDIGLDLSPATDRPGVQQALIELLKVPAPRAGAATVVAVDLDVVGPDLDAVPLDEVLDFRSAHGKQYRAYARRLREIVHILSTAPADEQDRILSDRREEVRTAAEELKRGPTTYLGVAGVGLGIAGGLAAVLTGGAALAVAGGAASAIAAAAGGIAAAAGKPTTAYSYLFDIGRGLR